MAEHQKINKDIILHAHQMVKHDKRFRNLMNQDWVDTQMQDRVISTVISWIWSSKTNKSTLDKYMKAKVVRPET